MAASDFPDRYIGVVRTGHPLSEGEITPLRFAAAERQIASIGGFTISLHPRMEGDPAIAGFVAVFETPAPSTLMGP